MALSLIPMLGAGSKLFYEDPDTPDTYIELPNGLNIGQVGSQGEPVETTPIRAVAREFIAGLKTPPDKQFTFNHQPGLAAYSDFLDEVDAGKNMKMKVTYPTGDEATFIVAMLGRMMSEPEGNAQLKMEVFGKQSGDPEWAITA
ncbi:hypothetical protein TDB9533_01232 [Thalassocella blandensis]|nr:hypothetical protein TDB9533_01232 [Thalassocella blandensis]